MSQQLERQRKTDHFPKTNKKKQIKMQTTQNQGPKKRPLKYWLALNVAGMLPVIEESSVW